MRYKRIDLKRKSKIVLLLEEHIVRNKRDYIIALLVFFLGIIIGTILVNNSTDESKQSMYGYISEFIDSIKSKEYIIDSRKLLIKSLISNIELAVVIWLAGLSIVGIPLVYTSVGYKGVCVGYSVSAIIGTLSKAKGIVFILSSMFFQNIIAIPCILALSVSSMKMYKVMTKKEGRNSLKNEAYRHTFFSFFMVIGLVVSSFIEIFISTNITSNIITNFI